MKVLESIKVHVSKIFESWDIEERADRVVTYIDKEFKLHKKRFPEGKYPAHMTDEEVFLYHKSLEKIGKLVKGGVINNKDVNDWLENISEEVEKKKKEVEKD